MEDIRIPHEGISTLSAAFTKAYVDKIVRGIRKLRDRGVDEETIRKTLRAELKDLDEFTLARVYEISLDREIPDDFPSGNIEEEREEKRGSYLLRIKALPRALVVGSIVQHRGQACCIVGVEGLAVKLKALR